MIVEFAVNKVAAKAMVSLWVLCGCSLLTFGVISNFVVGALTDDRVGISRATLAVASGYFPNRARLRARLAQASERDRDLAAAENNALHAVKLSPYNYSYRLLLAGIKESIGEPAEAEQSLRSALMLAPNKTDVRWQLANLLLRKSDLVQAVEEFRAACALNPRLLPVTLHMVWRASGGSLEAVADIPSSEPKPRIALAQFLLAQSSPENGARVFNRLGRAARLAPAEAGSFLNALIAAEHLSLARDLWMGLFTHDGHDATMIWNGSFETEVARDLAQFDWMTYSNEYARIRIDTGVARTGSRSLRIDFTGRDTSRLDGEIKQLILVRPGVAYRLECYAKPERLVTSEGPRVVVTSNTSPDWIGASRPVAADEAGWQLLEFEFVAPASPTGDTAALLVTIKRRPKFSYDQPTRGTVYFDDFALTQLAAGSGRLPASVGH
jgi:tetratricopeptide (TPR) repeat protein